MADCTHQEKFEHELQTTQEIGLPLPLHDNYAVSVSLPTWSSVVGYEEGDHKIVAKMTSGYPRFRFHDSVAGLMTLLLAIYYQETRDRSSAIDLSANKDHATSVSVEKFNTSATVLILPSLAVANRCFHFMMEAHPGECIEVYRLTNCKLFAVFSPTTVASTAKKFWQHSGEIITGRQAEACLSSLLQHITLEYTSSSASFTNHTSNDDATSIYQAVVRLYACKSDVCLKLMPNRQNSSTEPDEHQDVLLLQPVRSSTRTSPEYDITTNNSSSVCGENDGNVSTTYHTIVERIQRIIAYTTTDTDTESPSVHDITLCVSGMAAIFTAFRVVQQAYTRATDRADGHVVVFGFPYLDTLKIMQRPEWNRGGVTFFGHGNEADLDALELLLQQSIFDSSATSVPSSSSTLSSTNIFRTKIMGIFMEFPSNPLMKTVQMSRLVQLAQSYGVLLVADDTISSFANTDLFQIPKSSCETDATQTDTQKVKGVDILCSSLTKIFSGTGNVMAGSLILNPFTDSVALNSQRYELLKQIVSDMQSHNDIPVPFEADLSVLELNSRDFLWRSHRVNQTALQLANYFLSKQQEGIIVSVNYPGLSHSPEAALYKSNYDQVLKGQRLPFSLTQSCVDNSINSCKVAAEEQFHQAGYGCLISFVIHERYATEVFYDHLLLNKGPSLGANFTLVCPYTLLAHYTELDFANSYNVHAHLIRVSVGLEEFSDLRTKFEDAFSAMICK